jgi:hypothetical protein
MRAVGLPRCPSCGSTIFPSAREGGDTTSLCEACKAKAKMTPLPPIGREEVIEPSGPFMLPDAALPPEEVLDHLGSKPPPPPAPEDEIVIEPSGPLVLPGTTAPPLPGIAPSEVATEDEIVEEPSGPLVVPASAPPVSLDATGEAVDPFLHAGAAVVRGGLVRGAARAHHTPPPEVPTIVVDPGLSDRPRDTASAPRPEPVQAPSAVVVEEAAAHASPRGPVARIGEAAQASWTPLAIAFVAGMLAGAALVLAILRL